VLLLIDEISHEPDFAPMILRMTAQRQSHYVNELLSMLRESPEERYIRLLREKPDLFKRVPQHYIASYMGVSKVHLSRIKAKVAKGKRHF
jgi:CRP-like cAMP-binding protein